MDHDIKAWKLIDTYNCIQLNHAYSVDNTVAAAGLPVVAALEGPDVAACGTAAASVRASPTFRLQIS